MLRKCFRIVSEILKKRRRAEISAPAAWRRTLRPRLRESVLTAKREMASSTSAPTVIQRKDLFMPCIRAPSPYAAPDPALTAVMVPTNTAEPMDPAMVRKEVSREEASAMKRAGGDQWGGAAGGWHLDGMEWIL